MISNKFYVVWKGRKPGIYRSWDECKAQVEMFPGAKYKAFKNRSEAEHAYKEGYSTFTTPPGKKVSTTPGQFIRESLAVDAACSGNPGIMEYQGVDVATGQEIFHRGPFRTGTNNIGEFLALVHALALLKKENSAIPVYTDSGTALAWLRNKKVKTMLPRDGAGEEIWKLIEKAEEWLRNNKYSNPVLKW